MLVSRQHFIHFAKTTPTHSDLFARTPQVPSTKSMLNRAFSSREDRTGHPPTSLRLPQKASLVRPDRWTGIYRICLITNTTWSVAQSCGRMLVTPNEFVRDLTQALLASFSASSHDHDIATTYQRWYACRIPCSSSNNSSTYNFVPIGLDRLPKSNGAKQTASRQLTYQLAAWTTPGFVIERIPNHHIFTT